MLFIGFYWYSPENAATYIEKFRQLNEERKKGTEKSPKIVFGPYHFAGQRKGFAVYETDDPDKFMTLAMFFAPELDFKFVPLIDNVKTAELYSKMLK